MVELRTTDDRWLVRQEALAAVGARAIVRLGGAVVNEGGAFDSERLPVDEYLC